MCTRVPAAHLTHLSPPGPAPAPPCSLGVASIYGVSRGVPPVCAGMTVGRGAVGSRPKRAKKPPAARLSTPALLGADWPAPAQWPPGGHGAPQERAAARTHSTCTALNRCTLRCDLPKPGLAAFGMVFGANEDARSSHNCAPESGMYPTFDSAAGSGEIPVFFGMLPDLILRVT